MSIEDDIRDMIEAKRHENEVALEQQRQQKVARELAAVHFARELNQVLRDNVIVTLTRASKELHAQRLRANVAYSLVAGSALVDDVVLTFYDPNRSTRRTFIRYKGNEQRHIIFVETGSLPISRTDRYKSFKKVSLNEVTTELVEEHVKAFVRAVIRLNEVI
jgi:site-specific recombinase XerD